MRIFSLTAVVRSPKWHGAFISHSLRDGVFPPSHWRMTQAYRAVLFCELRSDCLLPRLHADKRLPHGYSSGRSLVAFCSSGLFSLTSDFGEGLM